MTAPALQQLLLLLMIVGFFLAIFGKAVGLPDWTEMAGTLFGGFCAITGLIIQRRAKKRAGQAITVTRQQRLRRRWLFIALAVVTTLSAPFWVPANGVNLPVSYRVLIAVLTCGMAVGIVLMATRDNQPKV